MSVGEYQCVRNQGTKNSTFASSSSVRRILPFQSTRVYTLQYFFYKDLHIPVV